MECRAHPGRAALPWAGWLGEGVGEAVGEGVGEAVGEGVGEGLGVLEDGWVHGCANG